MFVVNFHMVYFIYVLTKVFCYLYFNFFSLEMIALKNRLTILPRKSMKVLKEWLISLIIVHCCRELPKKHCLFVIVPLLLLGIQKLQFMTLIVFYYTSCLPEHEAPCWNGSWSTIHEENCSYPQVFRLGAWVARCEKVENHQSLFTDFRKTVAEEAVCE